LRDIRAFRDPGWEQRERSYHEVALKEVNSLVRKYNGAAPYTVRRPFYARNIEMERVYEACAEDIWRELAERARGSTLPCDMPSGEAMENAGIDADAGQVGEVWSVGDHLRKWVESVVSRLRSRMW
jgi:DnaJ homolog subfamily C member 28